MRGKPAPGQRDLFVTIPMPSMAERAKAAEAARALRAAVADPARRGRRDTMHIDYSRPRRGEWISTWANLPGLSCVNGAYFHEHLPGWQYTEDEIEAEMIPDLEAFAERGVLPTEATTGGRG